FGVATAQMASLGVAEIGAHQVDRSDLLWESSWVIRTSSRARASIRPAGQSSPHPMTVPRDFGMQLRTPRSAYSRREKQARHGSLLPERALMPPGNVSSLRG